MPQSSVRSPRRSLVRLVLTGTGSIVVAALAFFAWQGFYPVQATDDWSVAVLHKNVQKAASLVPLPDGSLLVSQELKKDKGNILRIAADGQRRVMVDGLSKPDGMIAARGGWVFSQESDGRPVQMLKDGKITDLFMGQSVQGLWDDGENLYAIEDRGENGRLLRYRWSDGELTVLRDKLQETESVTRCTDGRLLYTEKKKGVVHQFSDDGKDPVLLAGLNQPTFLMCDQRGLWISEDSTHRARLLLWDGKGEPRTILSFLKAPQSIVPDGKGGYLLAEGGRDRVLQLIPAK
ncbi:hypothetical protein N5J43_28615 [Pseudomonas nicosulfuronedens]|uniref:Uncharacterized protein n=1 Tax=Pseudomonas nicosulfuronedens TaxID=2571105 RepID=A0A5R9QMF6_9PSED|nr:hypothetical protein [Pseudomonas nicosulfuronedens]MDH1013004.1 hypothetical protein [Pseudomonas nicosulfuronedens]MDH1982937.1 hypothetical protein [Pseudomonas nicosulfuronedens]MDH2030661.1 hypothetical protein [Pseudomonas nicosulfuronedens]TLX70724.1 hypothetical protein FAS41_27170 [Pseudomonas nicosulfuronedens]